jgi:glycerophosphoryl diester phosphodiesterase
MADSFWSRPPMAIAHRGGGAVFGKEKYRKENTLEAFNRTVNVGIKYLELDVIATADNKVIVLHVARNKLDEMFYGKKEAPTYQGLQKLTHEQLMKKLGRKIPTIEQILKTFPTTKFFIDAKTDKVVERLASAIVSCGACNRVCVGSFAPKRIKKLQQLLGPAGNTRLNISLSPLAFPKQWWFLRSNKLIQAIDLHYFYTRKITVRYIHKKGLKVLSWTPNTEEQIIRCARLGVDGIMSDSPKLLLNVLD